MRNTSLSLEQHQKLLRKAQKRLKKVLRLAQRHQQLGGFTMNPIDDMEDLLARSMAQMFTNGFPRQRMSREIPSSTTASPDIGDMEIDLCTDILGRDRACCNSASLCFDDLRGKVEELEQSPNDFTLLSACRLVSAELKRDRLCVQQSLARCRGPGRATLQTRFDSRIDNLYDQFYTHCRRELTRSTQPVTQAPTTVPTTVVRQTSNIEPIPVDPSIQTTTLQHGGHRGILTTASAPGGGSSSRLEDAGNGLIIAGVITGGFLLLLVLMAAIFCWCRNRKERDGSDSSAGSTFVFFKRRPKIFSSSRTSDSGNKQTIVRQESSVYAEIDESIVNPSFKPPAPYKISNASYISPICDEDDVFPAPAGASNVPMVTTRGQMNYGPILAANSMGDNMQPMFYHSVSVRNDRDPRISSTSETNSRTSFNPDLPSGNFQMLSNPAGIRCADNSYIEAEMTSDGNQDDYEEPISAQSSLRYAQLNNDPPVEYAPSVPDAAGNKTPEIPGKSVSTNSFAQVSMAPSGEQPIAKPRRKRNAKDNPEEAPENRAIAGRRGDVGRDSNTSSASTMSSHHYFVLEKDQAMDYENSVSASKIV